MKKHTIAIVLAAGQGKRMNSTVRKQYLLIHEKPVLYYTLKAFEDSFIDEIVLVVGEGETDYCRDIFINEYRFSKITDIIVGGKERYHSVYNALLWVEQKQKNDSYVFIHDGARPFVTNDILERTYDKVATQGACIVGVPVKDTIKVIDEHGVVQTTPDRNTLWAVQTPQAFSFRKIKAAYDKLMYEEMRGTLKKAITDDAMVMESYGDVSVCIAEGSYDNIKITTPEDMLLAEQILKKK